MKKSYCLEDLASILECTLVGDGLHEIQGVDEIQTALQQDATFLANLKYKEHLALTAAGVIILHPDIARIEGKNYLLTEQPSQAFQKLIQLLFPDSVKSAFVGIHPTAIIHPSVKLGVNVEIGPYVVIDKDVVIGDQTSIFSHVSIGPGVTIGGETLIYPHVVIRENCTIGNRVILQPSVIIGQCGFGYITDNRGNHTKIKHVGNVIIEDDVEIGAATIIERARFKSTRIGAGTKVSMLVGIAHNVVLGKNNMIIGQVGFSGSVKTGDHVTIAGQAGLAGHIEIASGTIITGRAGVTKSILKKDIYSGHPATPISENQIKEIHIRRLPQYIKRLVALEKLIQAKTAPLAEQQELTTSS